MTTDSLITIGVSIITSGITAFAIVAFKMGRYSEKIDQLEKCNLNTRLSTLEGKQLTRRSSPVNLTAYGNTVLNNSGGKDFIDKNYLEIKKKVESENTQTSYDIQEASRKAVESLQNDLRINTIKDFLFKEGMEWADIVEVLGIYLRDKILKEKGIDPVDIDKHDPAKTTHTNAKT